MHTANPTEGPSADQALARLIAGNERFVRCETRLALAVESNVRWTTNQIRATPEARARTGEGRLKVVGAVYEIESGRVRLLPEQI